MEKKMEPDSPTAPGQLRILMVEDHGETRDVLADLLRHVGHEVAVAASVADGVQAINAERFDVILSDIGLPDGSGYSLLAQARQKQPAIRAIALTGFVTEQDARFSREAGFDFHLTKPLDFHELRTVLGQMA
jgi:CheY-like chemotaxis protein